MYCPTISELPTPPPGRTGWPWTEESPQQSDTMPDGRPWPRVSIVTPSYNQGQFIEETIRSVLLQGYPNLEYIIMDGGSTDGSLEIIRKYESWLTHWESKRDKGQSDAINQGWQLCSGEIMAWINSDDYYLPRVLNRIAESFVKNPYMGLIYGNIQIVINQGKPSAPIKYRASTEKMLGELIIPNQPACFFSSNLLAVVGWLDTSLHYVMDVDLFVKLMSNAPWYYIPYPLAVFRIQDMSKTGTAEERFASELLIVLDNIISNYSNYPTLKNTALGKMKSNFYRLACKHFYMGGIYEKSLLYLLKAAQEYPCSIPSLISNEGIRWLVRRLIPVEIYRRFSLAFSFFHGLVIF